MTSSRKQIAELADEGSFRPRDHDLSARDPLTYPGYAGARARAAERAATDESVVAGSASIDGHAVELALFDFSFMGGSMGEVAGERLARAMERAAQRAVPFVLRTATGGARMQEGMRSLIQMPKVVAARLTLAEAHQAFVAILGHPTTGGVFASIGSLADVTVAERGATIGFAGPRVAERMTGRPLPPGSHTAEFAHDNGMVDQIVEPDRVREWTAGTLTCIARDDKTDRPQPPASPEGGERPDPWEVVSAARERKQKDIDYTGGLVDVAVTLDGDRAGARGAGVGAALARTSGRRFLLLHVRDPLDPASFRKAMRCIDIATRLSVPVVTLVDTAGADPSVESESQGIAGLIARTTEKLLSAPVPVLAIVTGEGGSGGALAFATGDRLIAYQTSYFSVIAPEAAAEILWKDATRAPEAARLLKLTALDLLALGIADEVVAGSPSDGSLKQAVTYHLDRLAEDQSAHGRALRRRSRWRNTR